MTKKTHFTLPALFDDLAIGIIVHDPKTGAVLDVNKQIEETYGYSASDLQQMGFEEYTAPSTRVSLEEIRSKITAAAADKPQEFEWQIKRATGELVWVRMHLTATTIDETELVLGEVQEITEYRARERRLRLLSRVIRHNLRNKVTVINGYGERIKKAVEDETLESEVQSLLTIASEIGNLSESVSQIEEIAAPDATQRSPTNIVSVITATAEKFRSTYPNVELTVDAPAEVWVVADKGVNYAIDHAIENAITHNGGDSPEVTIKVVDDHANEHGKIQVADNGPTIPENEIQVLDDAVETSSTYHGTGVGLWVMQWCVNSLGGKLTFQKNTPKGNIVTIVLPKSAE